MTATMIIRHSVADYAKWRGVYDAAGAQIQEKHSVLTSEVLQLPDDSNEIIVIHTFDDVEQAQALAGDPGLKSAMAEAGVTSPPRLEIFVNA